MSDNKDNSNRVLHNKSELNPLYGPFHSCTGLLGPYECCPAATIVMLIALQTHYVTDSNPSGLSSHLSVHKQSSSFITFGMCLEGLNDIFIAIKVWIDTLCQTVCCQTVTRCMLDMYFSSYQDNITLQFRINV